MQQAHRYFILIKQRFGSSYNVNFILNTLSRLHEKSRGRREQRLEHKLNNAEQNFSNGGYCNQSKGSVAVTQLHPTSVQSAFLYSFYSAWSGDQHVWIKYKGFQNQASHRHFQEETRKAKVFQRLKHPKGPTVPG